MASTQWLIDGHNLIGQLQDLSLDDPYDEAKLTAAVRRYCMSSRTKATIIFDNGLPGGFSKQLSNSDVTVIFAPPRTQADTLLMRRAKEAGNLKDLVLVTSDRRIARLAYAYGLETMASEEFALMIGFRPVEITQAETTASAAPPPQITIVYEKNPNPLVTPQEIAYWLPIFKRKLAEVRAAAAQTRLDEKEALRQRRQERREKPSDK